MYRKLKAALECLRNELCTQYCRVCELNCCTGRVNPEVGKSPFFSTLTVVKKTSPDFSEPYLLRSWGKIHLVGRCPYLSDEGLCLIHSEPERPQDCKEYPLTIDYIYPFLNPVVKAEKSCPIFSNRSACRAVYEFCAEHGVEAFFI